MFFWWNVGVWQPKFMGNFPTMLHSVRTYSSAIAGSTRILEESWSIMEAHWSAYAALLPPWWLPQRRPSWRCVGWPRVRLHSNHKLCRWRADQGSLREVNRWPPLKVSRKDDWSWELSNHLYRYNSIPDADKKGCTGPLFPVWWTHFSAAKSWSGCHDLMLVETWRVQQELCLVFER